MPTFRSKEIIDARQFDGTPENAKELVEWAKANNADYRSSTLSISRSVHELGSRDPLVVIPTPCLIIYFGKEPKDWAHLSLKPTDWLIRKQDGQLKVDFDTNFKRKYEQV